MSGREAIPFTVKGPFTIQVIESSSSDAGRKTGCAIMDLKFPNPSQIGELVLSNYYTAWIAIYVKRAPAKTSNAGQGKVANAGATSRARPQFERSISVDLSGSEFRNRNDSTESGQGSDLSENMQCNFQNISSRRRHSSGPNSAEGSERPWECCVPMKTLMPCPHFEAGCQDIFSVPATESLIEMRDVIILRILLYQPSTVWKRFAVEDVYVFKNLPKRGCTQIDDICRQREGWLATLRLNTKKMLGGQLVEPEKYESDDEGIS